MASSAYLAQFESEHIISEATFKLAGMAEFLDLFNIKKNMMGNRRALYSHSDGG